MEHQRQLEWERQRRDQLMAESQREHSQVDKLRLEIGQHRQELDIVVRCAALYRVQPKQTRTDETCNRLLAGFW